MISERSFVVCPSPLAIWQRHRRDHPQHAAEQPPGTGKITAMEVEIANHVGTIEEVVAL